MTEAHLNAVAVTIASAKKQAGADLQRLFTMQASVERAQVAIHNSLRTIRDAQRVALLEKLRK